MTRASHRTEQPERDREGIAVASAAVRLDRPTSELKRKARFARLEGKDALRMKVIDPQPGPGILDGSPDHGRRLAGA